MSVAQTKCVNLRETRRTITKFIQDGALDNRVFAALVHDNLFIPKECEIWDYKREAGKDARSLAETILQVVSFYNTYGGYLVYGVDEIIHDVKFSPIGIAEGNLNIQQLRQAILNYTGEVIDISYREIEYLVASKNYLFGLLHIPKRSRTKAPIFFGKNGPQKETGDLVFSKDAAYMRIQEKCVQARTKDDFQLLFGERINPFLWDIDSPMQVSEVRTVIVEHNLPDRNFICPKFVGRGQLIQELWKWLADELANVKVLAGDGGKGKTSIAYEFAEEVCRTGPYGIERVIWLTAKSRQFIGSLDEFVKVPQTNFFDLESLLKSLCSESAILDRETEGASISMLKRLIKTALNNIACLIIIDDIDSTELEQQRLIMETAMQFPGSRARFLLTTRMNLSYSSSACLTVGGLDKEDYLIFVNDVLERFECAPLKNKKIERMRIATDGSPLFTDSLLRLYRMGMAIDKSMQEWKGKLGNEVRKAALQREVEKLTLESRRVLLACSYMGEASLTELQQVTAYEDQRMQLCINELQSLFLISAKPLIKKELRFTVSNNTARLILENREMLVPDPTALHNIVAKLRKGRESSIMRKPYLHPVGAAITQAVAFLRVEKYDDAIATIEAALQDYRNNPDLLLARGRCLFEKYNANKNSRFLDMARRAFNKAYDNGQRKEVLFDLWFRSEMFAKHPMGAVDVATSAINKEIPIKIEWLQRRADALLEQSRAYRRTINYDLALEQVNKAAGDISEALSISSHLQKPALLEKLYRIDDEIWPLADNASYELRGIPSIKSLFDTAHSMIKLGDYRQVNFERLYSAISDVYSPVAKSKKVTKGQMNVLQEMLRKSGELLSELARPKEYRELLDVLLIKQQKLEEAIKQLKLNIPSTDN